VNWTERSDYAEWQYSLNKAQVGGLTNVNRPDAVFQWGCLTLVADTRRNLMQ